MSMLITAFASLIALIKGLFDFARERKIEESAKAVVERDILKENQEKASKNETIILEPRNVSDASQRLRNGSF